jgi:hypothetical protein
VATSATSDALATIMVLAATGGLVLAGLAVRQRRVFGWNAEAKGPNSYLISAAGGLLASSALTIEAFGLVHRQSVVGLVGSLVMLGASGA